MSTEPDSIFNEAYRLYEKGNHKASFEVFSQGAEAGDSSCMVWLGILYGDGVKEDKQNSNEIYWYKKAWEKRDPSAPSNLAIVYKNKNEFAEAEKWFMVAIENGDGDANLELAKMYIIMEKDNSIIRKFLQDTIDSVSVTEKSIEEAHELLDIYA